MGQQKKEESFDFERINREERPFSDCLLRELRSDHAGEMGAVWIYRGGLIGSYLNPFSRGLRDEILTHLESEEVHLNGFASILTLKEKSLLTPLWLIMGFGLGLISSLLGPAVFNVMVEGVETYVDEHYEGQIQYVLAYNEACQKGLSPPTSLDDLSSTSPTPSPSAHKPHPELLRFLRKCQADEVEHRDDAHHNLLHLKYTPINPVSPKPPLKSTSSGPVQLFLNAWGWLSDFGSRCAVSIAKRI
uniref:Ubiquinone biosynthesis monooxygenase COQ7 n=1 Tax=Paramoeba aestuarina TaxID=180227 RepID=A0A7S4KM82_9EUKA